MVEYVSEDSKSRTISKLYDWFKSYDSFTDTLCQILVRVFLHLEPVDNEGVSRGRSLDVCICDRWKVTCDMCLVKCDT